MPILYVPDCTTLSASIIFSFVSIFVIAPSLTDTPLADKLINAEAKLKSAEDRHPLKKIGTPNDIANAVQYLLNANWVTGQIISVDGGMSALR